MTNTLFFILQANIPSPLCSTIKARTCNCLSEISYTRHSLFTSTETRLEFVKSFANLMIKTLQSDTKTQYILKDRTIYKEFVKIP